MRSRRSHCGTGRHDRPRSDQSATQPPPEPPPSDRDDALTGASVEELGELVRTVIATLAARVDDTAFGELLSLYETLGVALGESARTLAEDGSWARVAGVAGTSRQAAWYRWRQ